MTDPVNADRRARAALTCLPPDRHRTQRIHRHGPITVWERIAGRYPDIDPGRLLEQATESGWRLVIPGDPDWPATLDVPGRPLGLWVHGAGDLPGLLRRAVTLTGALAGSAYGRTVAADLATKLTTQPGGESVTVVAHGGGNGTDVAALTAAARRPAAVAVLDTPTDLFGQPDLLRTVAAGGLLVSAAAPDANPTPGHVLARIELLAALAHATVLIEARASDDDALSVAYTAHFRRRRPVLAVPGPITALASAGPHALLRDGTARCVTTAGHITAHLPDPPAPR
ncbi:putative DNA processing smf-family protein [Parafrankia sp. EAN1pec]|uniref:DNA-processing protein DprA n=1 Tax=Parafrankia sp. (strain EAN1pec) TaxID=298653 RepID=UPI0000544FE2|nr:putative DNA processing smf-family protein [Frankia sp. EAN1pec]